MPCRKFIESSFKAVIVLLNSENSCCLRIKFSILRTILTPVAQLSIQVIFISHLYLATEFRLMD